MKKTSFLFPFLVSLLLVGGCKTVRIEGPAVSVPGAKPRIEKAKTSLKNKKEAAVTLPDTLGGLISSDRWLIHNDKQQEEFIGNVSYESDVYTFHADYARSERTNNRIAASGNIYLKQAKPNEPTYEIYADYGDYNYQQKKGNLSATQGKELRLIYQEKNQQPVVAYGKNASFNLETGSFLLTGNVRVLRPTPQGMQTMSAQQASYLQKQNYLELKGGAKVSDELRTLAAETIIYDGTKNYSYAYGSRPLLTGKSEQGTFAIIADKVQSDNEGNKINMNGKVQGWLISPEINDAAFNDKF